MRNLSKVQKLLLGTSLAGALLVFAGYGTFSWFTSDPVDVGGEIEHLVVDLNSDVESIDYEITDGTDLLAPGRTAIGDLVTLSNGSTEDTIFNMGYSFQLLKDGEPVEGDVSLSQYSPAAVMAVDEGVTGKDLYHVLQSYFAFPDGYFEETYDSFKGEEGDTIYVAKANQENFKFLYQDLKAGEIDAILFPDGHFFPDSTFFPDSSFSGTFFPDGYFSNSDFPDTRLFPDDYFFPDSSFDEVAFPDTIFTLEEGQDVQFLFGVHMKGDTGNEYQGLTLDTDFRFGTSQVPGGGVAFE